MSTIWLCYEKRKVRNNYEPLVHWNTPAGCILRLDFTSLLSVALTVSPLALPSTRQGNSPCLHHLLSFGKVRLPVVGSAVRVVHRLA